MEVRVSRYRDLKEGDILSFFYPSTEWTMVQPFMCFCNEETCLGKINGASQMGKAKLKGYWLNQHIEEKFWKVGSNRENAMTAREEADIFVDGIATAGA